MMDASAWVRCDDLISWVPEPERVYKRKRARGCALAGRFTT